MSDKNNAAETETTNTLTDEQAVDQFQGFATRDGERVEPASVTSADDKPAKGGGAGKPDEPKTPPDDESETDAEASQRHKSAQERINKAVAKQRAAERRADTLEQRLSALEQRSSAPQSNSQQQSKPKSDPNAPQAADYQYGELDAGFIRDLARYETRKELETVQQRSQEEQSKASQTKAQQEFQQKLDGFLEKGVDIADDFEEIVKDDGFRVSQVLAELAMESDHGPEILYSAGSDSKEAKRISAMSPARQAAWFGQREAELSSGSSDAEEGTETERSHRTSSPKTTQAPPPPKGKTRGSGTAQQVSPATSDFTQFERLAMKKQE